MMRWRNLSNVGHSAAGQNSMVGRGFIARKPSPQPGRLRFGSIAKQTKWCEVRKQGACPAESCPPPEGSQQPITEARDALLR
jgi:hypothetical protein